MAEKLLDLTERQRDVLAALERLARRDGSAPSMRRLAPEIGLASTSSVHHVRVLEDTELVGPGRGHDPSLPAGSPGRP